MKEVRQLKKEEYIQSVKAESVSFDIGLDFSDENVSDNKDCSYNIRRAVLVDGKVVSCLDMFPLTALLNGKEVGMSGIGGVVSLPEERRKGYVRDLFKDMLKESFNRGYALSYLYPFSNVYYRQFGYEMSMTKNKITLPTADFAKYRNRDTVKLYQPCDDYSDIEKIYNEFAKDKNCMVVRSKNEWKRVIGKDPYKNRRYTYIHYNNDNTPDAYVILMPNNSSCDDNSVLCVKELVWNGVDALKGVFGFLYNFAGRYKTTELTVPSFVNLRHFVDEPYDMKIENICFGMLRIVNAAKVFETLDISEIQDSVVIKVTDDFLEENNKTFIIENNGNVAEVKETHTLPDITLDIRTLSQIVSGYLTFDEAVQMKKVELNKQNDTLAKLFGNPHPCIIDEF